MKNPTTPPAAATADAPLPMSACGLLAANWINDEYPPAVIVNNAARPVDVLAWCWGELTALRSVLQGLSEGGSDIAPDLLRDALFHHIDPLPDVLGAVISGMCFSDEQKGGAA